MYRQRGVNLTIKELLARADTETCEYSKAAPVKSDILAAKRILQKLMGLPHNSSGTHNPPTVSYIEEVSYSG